MEYASIKVAGLSWQIRPLDPDEQIEVECILIRMFGAAAGAAIGALAHGLAPVLIDVLRETVGEGEKFDLARIGSMDSSDPRLQSAWESLLDSIGDTAAELIGGGLSVFSSRVSFQDILRLFELAILSRKALVIGPTGESMYVENYTALGDLLRRDPKAKWRLLSEALQVTYGRKAEEAAEG